MKKYRIWWRGHSGRVHKFKKPVIRFQTSMGDWWTAKGFLLLPPAIAWHIVKVKKWKKRK